LVESKAWAMYRERRKQFASLIGDREPIVLKRQLPGMGRAMRYIITIADDDRRLLQNLCRKLSATNVACDVMRTKFGPARFVTLKQTIWLLINLHGMSSLGVLCKQPRNCEPESK
jgi:hypothetical protein